MTTLVSKVDQSGRVTLPQAILDAAGITRDAEVVIEASSERIVIRPRQLPTITARIAAMELPVADWPAMEDEIAREHR